MDTGGLAQMTYNDTNTFTSANGIGLPGSGFASRGKGAHIQRLSVAPHSSINSIYEDEPDMQPPRTSRSHLLAGLRTAPKPSSNTPASAPYWQSNHQNPEPQPYGDRGNMRRPRDAPRTAAASHFPGNSQGHHFSNSRSQQMYSLPEQVLSPQDLAFGLGNDESMDPEVYNELMSQNLYLLQRQQQLQQQLLNVTAAAQQFQGLNFNGNNNAPATPVTPGMSLYNQQLQNGLQPQITPVPNQPGVYTVYNPMTGQQSLFYDQFSSQQQFGSSPPQSGSMHPATSPDQDNVRYHRGVGSSSNALPSQGRPARTITPPKGTPSPPQDVKPLPAPSSNAYRPGHRKSLSNALTNASYNAGNDGLKNSVPRSAGFPQTPMTGTFGPGMARAGEHPTRQPRGPPPLEELIALPTSKHEGSKNFATRQRRRAVHNLVRAGNERRSGRCGSADAGTPSSEGDLNFVISDADSEGSANNSDRGLAANTTPDYDVPTWMDMRHAQFTSHVDESGASAFQRESEKRRTPLLVLASAAEKRKSTRF